MGGGATYRLVINNGNGIGSSQSSYFIGNPEISYFKFAYKRHTNFTMETLKLTFKNSPFLSNTYNKFRCPIDNTGGNFLTDLYLRYKIPDIYSNDTHKFRWIPNFGSLLIKKADFYINSFLIDSISGEWLVISNELTNLVKDNFNNMTGNVSSLFNPKMDIPVITINNNRYANAYPIGNKSNGTVSIKGREIIVPLNFSFTKNPSLGIILSKIPNQGGTINEIYVEIEFESIENLYQVYSSDLNLFISPIYYNELYPNDKINFDTFVINKEINAYIEANYAFIDMDELQSIATYTTQIVIETIQINEGNTVLIPGIDLANTINLNKCNNMIKEIIWTTKRNDFYKYNNQLNYTNSIPENNDKPIMSKALFRLQDSGTIIVDENDTNFYNLIQPYKHHTSIPRQGIYCYSFALFPEKYQPSGVLDGSRINTQLILYTNNQDNSSINEKLTKLGRSAYTYNYILSYYIRSFNILEYTSGTVAYKFAA